MGYRAAADKVDPLQGHMMQKSKITATEETTPQANGSVPSLSPTGGYNVASTSAKKRKAEDGGSPNEAVGKKGKPKKGKRFLWTEELHRRFVAAVFDVGLKHASPKALYMILGDAAVQNKVTTEHIKSHLQKFRLHSQKSREQFLKYHEEATVRAQEMGYGTTLTVYPVTSKPPPASKTAVTGPPQTNSAYQNYQEGDAATAKPASALGKLFHNIQPSGPPPRIPSQPQPEEAIHHHNAGADGLRRQVQMQARSLQLQAEYQEALQHQLLEQQRLQQELQEKLALLQAQAQLNGVQIPAEPPTTVSLSSSVSDGVPMENKTRLQIQLAMQSQMNMHRQMLLRQAGQVALHGGSLPNYSVAAASSSSPGSLSSEMEARRDKPQNDKPSSSPNRNLQPSSAPVGPDSNAAPPSDASMNFTPSGDHFQNNQSASSHSNLLETFDWTMSDDELFQFLL